MSGVEVAGIALAVFPILIDALAHYKNGLGLINNWRRYRNRLQNYADSLETGKVCYLNTIELLLQDIVQSDDEIKLLMDDPGGDLWSKPEYEEKLMRRLGRSYEVYLKTLHKMNNALKTLCEKLGADPSGKVLWKGISGAKLERKRLKFTLQRDAYNEALEVIRLANGDLREITSQSIKLEAGRQKGRSKRDIDKLRLVRKHAASLYQAFITNKAWNCNCGHLASLRLELHPVAVESAKSDFRLLLSKQPKDCQGVTPEYQEVKVISSFDAKTSNTTNVDLQTKIRSVKFADYSPKSSRFNESTVNDHCKSITSLCGELFVSSRPDPLVGYIKGGENHDYKHSLYQIHTAIGSEGRTQSLSDLLSCSEHGPSKDRFRRRDRLRLAVTIASSVLQLHGTSWLKSQWNSKNIIFHENLEGEHFYPYLEWRHCFANNNSTYPVDSAFHANPPIPSETLLALGVTLVELCFGKSLAKMQSLSDQDSDEKNMRLKTAKRLVEDVYCEMGTSYGDAVRRCLHLQFNVRDMSLENEELQQLFFENVVTPLSNDLDNFEGRSRIR